MLEQNHKIKSVDIILVQSLKVNLKIFCYNFSNRLCWLFYHYNEHALFLICEYRSVHREFQCKCERCQVMEQVDAIWNDARNFRCQSCETSFIWKSIQVDYTQDVISWNVGNIQRGKIKQIYVLGGSWEHFYWRLQVIEMYLD